MAASLSRWLSSALMKATSQAYQGDQELFIRGSKAQILAFLGFNGTVARPEAEEDGLWAVVADREHSICVFFTAECVRYFDSTHTRPLLSLRGSIVGLKWYRPQVSSRAARMFAVGNDASSSGPFAQAEGSSFRTFLEVESIHLWGSINAPTFFDTTDLQFSLIHEASEGNGACSRAFVRWFGNAVSMAYRARASKPVVKGAGRTDLEVAKTNYVRASTPAIKQSNPVLQDASDRDAQGDDEFGIDSAADRAIDHDQGIERSLPADGGTDVLIDLNQETIDRSGLDHWRSSDLIEVPAEARKRKRESEPGVKAVRHHTHEAEALESRDQAKAQSIQFVELTQSEGNQGTEDWSDILV